MFFYRLLKTHSLAELRGDGFIGLPHGALVARGNQCVLGRVSGIGRETLDALQRRTVDSAVSRSIAERRRLAILGKTLTPAA